MGQTTLAAPAAETWLGSCSLSHLLERSELYQRGMFLGSTSALSRTLASGAVLVRGKPTIWLIFLDVLSPTAQECCPDEFRGSPAFVWGSQLCGISPCDAPDAVAAWCGPRSLQGTHAAVCTAPRSHRAAPCHMSHG